MKGKETCRNIVGTDILREGTFAITKGVMWERTGFNDERAHV